MGYWSYWRNTTLSTVWNRPPASDVQPLCKGRDGSYWSPFMKQLLANHLRISLPMNSRKYDLTLQG